MLWLGFSVFCINAHLLVINSLESPQTFLSQRRATSLSACVFPSLKDELMHDSGIYMVMKFISLIRECLHFHFRRSA